MPKLAVLVAVTVALTVTGCGGEDEPDTEKQAAAAAPAPSAMPTTQRLTWGEAAQVSGSNGGRIRVTPLAVLYTPGAKQSGKAENGLYAVISLKVEAVDKPDTTAGGAGGGLQWRGAGRTIATGDGNTATTAWIGAVPEFDSLIEPGRPREGIETFDVPSKGGRLVYLNPEDRTIAASWDMPATDQGSTLGLAKVHKRIRMFS
ncbi:hypothetical protein [Actinomadura litoris]|uniref:Lipoprotein n=1 Tax=Actinomadura litoris TaxID=2678616 RepID=A0A7K1KVD5_9ACTN|nr:hypothetical protein [Actinomadura litoris]MUN36103.1 hypothetical protein [Actinomadura litoris]